MAILKWSANLTLRLTPFRMSLLLTKIFMHDTKCTVFSICFLAVVVNAFGKKRH